MQEIALAVIGVCEANKRNVVLGSMSYSSPHHLCYWAPYSVMDKHDAVPNLALTKVASQGMVLDSSLGAGVTDEPFLYLRSTCNI